MDANKVKNDLAKIKFAITDAQDNTPTNQKHAGFIDRIKNTSASGMNKAMELYNSAVDAAANKLNKESAIGCNPYLTYLICCASLVLSIIALTSQLSGKKMTETIITQNEKTYVDNNNEENTEIMKQNEANLKSFKSNILWAIVLIVLAFIVVMGSLGIYYKNTNYDFKIKNPY